MYLHYLAVVLALAVSQSKFFKLKNFYTKLLLSGNCNIIADTALDVILSTTRSSLDPISIEDSKYKVKVNFLFSLHVGSIAFANTSITGLSNLSRVSETEFDFEDDGSLGGTIVLEVNDVKLYSVITPKFGIILDVGMPLPVEVTIGTLSTNFTVVTDSWGLNPQVKKLKITKLDNIQVDIKYPGKDILGPFSFITDRMLTDTVVALVKDRLRRRLEKNIKKKMNTSLSGYSFFG